MWILIHTKHLSWLPILMYPPKKWINYLECQLTASTKAKTREWDCWETFPTHCSRGRRNRPLKTYIYNRFSKSQSKTSIMKKLCLFFNIIPFFLSNSETRTIYKWSCGSLCSEPIEQEAEIMKGKSHLYAKMAFLAQSTISKGYI